MKGYGYSGKHRTWTTVSEFIQTLLIALIPSSVAALLSFFASLKASNTQIKAIKEQNKADIEKLIEQNKINIEALKEKHTLEMQAKDKEHEHQIEIMQLQHKNELIRDDENAKNKMVGDAITGMMSGLFSNQGPLADVMKEKLQEALKNKENQQGASREDMYGVNDREK